jgi:hypothetical protein
MALSETEEMVTLQDCEGVRWSDSRKALLVRYEGETEWIPKNCIHDDSECYEPDTEGTLKIPLKLAEEKNFV